MKRLLIIVACLMAAACTTTSTRLATAVERPAAGATVLLVKPDIELALLTATGLTESRADWTVEGAANIEEQLQRVVASSSHQFKVIDPQEAMGGRSGQLMRLHEAVGQSIIAFDYGPFKLPNKAKTFEWTIGEGARTLGELYDADYALFTYGRGTYASGGRVAAFLVASAFGVGIPLGSQQVFTSLVDLKTGRVIWFNVAVAGPSADMRNDEGAQSLIESVMRGAPL